MTSTRALSWLELVAASLLAVFAIWILFEFGSASPEVDPHGYLTAGGIAGLIVACALALGAAVLRIESKWRWLGQVPLVALLITMYIFK